MRLVQGHPISVVFSELRYLVSISLSIFDEIWSSSVCLFCVD